MQRICASIVQAVCSNLAPLWVLVDIDIDGTWTSSSLSCIKSKYCFLDNRTSTRYYLIIVSMLQYVPISEPLIIVIQSHWAWSFLIWSRTDHCDTSVMVNHIIWSRSGPHLMWIPCLRFNSPGDLGAITTPVSLQLRWLQEEQQGLDVVRCCAHIWGDQAMQVYGSLGWFTRCGILYTPIQTRIVQIRRTLGFNILCIYIFIIYIHTMYSLSTYIWYLYIHTLYMSIMLSVCNNKFNPTFPTLYNSHRCAWQELKSTTHCVPRSGGGKISVCLHWLSGIWDPCLCQQTQKLNDFMCQMFEVKWGWLNGFLLFTTRHLGYIWIL